MFFFFFQAEDGIRDDLVTGVQTCALPISIPCHNTTSFYLHINFSKSIFRCIVIFHLTAPFSVSRDAQDTSLLASVGRDCELAALQLSLPGLRQSHQSLQNHPPLLHPSLHLPIHS